MDIPSYYLQRPPLPTDSATLASYEALWERINTPGITDLTPYAPAPRWPFLAYLAEYKPVLFHGSGSAEISKLEPRQSSDLSEFGNRSAVYAASDGIWPLFYAILDRERLEISLVNACFRVGAANGKQSDPYYFFSINHEALAQAPWRTGSVYILPRAGFEPKPPVAKAGTTRHIMEWASLSAVAPLARLNVGPEDFPFLDAIRGHDLATLIQRAEANPQGFPWLDALPAAAEPERGA